MKILVKFNDNNYVPAIKAKVKAGTVIKMPERKWLTLTFERNRDTIEKIVVTTLKKVGNGMTLEEAKEIIAISLASLTKKEMGKGVMKPKHREGTPMVDHGDLRRRIGTKVEMGETTYGYGSDG